jgi:tight adherence protein C
MSVALIFGICVLVLAAGLGVLYFTYTGNDVHRRLAQLNLDAPPPETGNGPSAIQKLLDDEQKRTLERRLSEAGWYTLTPAKFTIFMLVGAGVGGFIGILVGFALQKLDYMTVIIFIIMLAAGIIAPNASLDRAIAARKKAVQRELPNFLDIVSTSIEAGTALSGALNVAIDSVSGPLHDELKLVSDDIRLGRSRSEALAAMAHRLREPDLTTTVTAIVQAEKLGGDIHQVLGSLANEARERRMMRAEEIAGTLPVKMVFPMALFMLPSLLMMIFGALAAQYYP